MENYPIDLHMHSSFSDDGSESPERLAALCRDAGIQVMAIADHNTVRALPAEEKATGDYGMPFIPAIEIDCRFRGVNFHVLGYGFDWHDPIFARIEKNVAEQNREASYVRLKKFQELGYALRAGEMAQAAAVLSDPSNWTGELFAQVLLARPEYRADPRLLPYRPGGARSANPYVNFYWDFCAQDKCCYAPMEYPALESVVKTLHQTGGLAVLAHPGANLPGHETLLEPLLAAELDGIEAFSSYHLAEQQRYYAGVARAHHLLATCGSDYHGKTKPSIALGQHGCPLPPQSMEQALLSRGLLHRAVF